MVRQVNSGSRVKNGLVFLDYPVRKCTSKRFVQRAICNRLYDDLSPKINS